jgi:Ca2+-binding RTX toxin-like protein
MKAQLNLETLEARDTPAAITLAGSTLRIDGSGYNDTVQVRFDDRGTWWWWDDQLNVTLTNNGGDNLYSTVNAGSANFIQFFGGDGNDRFTNFTGHSSEAHGGNGDDRLFGGHSRDYLYGEEGNDTLQGMSGDDNLYGGNGHDTVDGGFDNDYVSGDAGNDILLGGWGSDLVTGGAGDDNVNGDTADNYYINHSDGSTDTLYGDGGNDIFVQYHRRNWWGGWTDEDRPMDVGNGMDTIVHVNVW